MSLADEFDRMRPFLRATNDLSEGYPHPHRYQTYNVIYYKEDDIYAINPEDYSDRIPLTKPDVIIYEFDMRKFRETLGKMLGFHVSKDEFDVFDRSFPLGYWEPDGGTAYPVHLLLPDHYRRFSTLVHRLFVMDETPMIILTPTRTDWDDETLELFRKRRSVVATLEEVMDVNSDGAWTASEHWLETLTHFYNEINPPNLIDAPPPFEFRKRGEYWVIRFEGDDAYLKDTVGLRCIGQLLAKPCNPVFVMELRAILDGQKPDEIAQPVSREDVVDQATLSDLKERYLELQTDLEDAQRDGNEVVENEIEQEMEQIVQYLCQVKAKGGETRKISDDFEKARSATSKAFWRSVNQIRNDLPQLSNHLEKSCIVGMVCNYTPEKRIDWIL